MADIANIIIDSIPNKEEEEKSITRLSSIPLIKSLINEMKLSGKNSLRSAEVVGTTTVRLSNMTNN